MSDGLAATRGKMDPKFHPLRSKHSHGTALPLTKLIHWVFFFPLNGILKVQFKKTVRTVKQEPEQGTGRKRREDVCKECIHILLPFRSQQTTFSLTPVPSTEHIWGKTSTVWECTSSADALAELPQLSVKLTTSFPNSTLRVTLEGDIRNPVLCQFGHLSATVWIL